MAVTARAFRLTTIPRLRDPVLRARQTVVHHDAVRSHLWLRPRRKETRPISDVPPIWAHRRRRYFQDVGNFVTGARHRNAVGPCRLAVVQELVGTVQLLP